MSDPIAQMKQRVFSIVSRVFGVPLKDVNESSSPDTISSWDSLKHLQLILALEEEFGVSFSVDDITAMQTVDIIIKIIQHQTNLDA